MPKPFVPREDVYVGRTISWINELLNYSKFRLLVPLHLDLDYEPFDKDYVRNQLKASVNAMHTLALGFVTYSTYQFSADHSFLFFSKTLFVAALVHCLLGNAKIEVLDVFVKAIKFSGYPQDYALLEEAGTNQGKAIDALLALLMF